MSEILRSTPKRIVESSTIYKIPIYQRLFEWDKDSIWTLLNDLYSSYKNGLGKEPYYIGMLTANIDKEGILNLVDGQQRFTVSTLMGIVFYSYYKDDEWYKFLLVGNEPRLIFSAREEDANFLKKLIMDQEFLEHIISDKNCNEYVNRKMCEGLKAIKQWHPQEYKEEFRDTDFAHYVFEQMSFFITELPKDYIPKDMNRYFEAMNSLGRNLESHEILEIDCLKLLPSKDTDTCDKAFYNQIWNLVADMDTPLIRKINNKDVTKRETEKEYSERFLNNISLVRKGNCLDDIKGHIKRNGKNGLNDLGEVNDNKPLNIGEVKADVNSKPSPRHHEGSHHSMLNFSEFLLEVLYLQQGMPNNINVNEFFDVHKLSETFKGQLEKWRNDKSDCKTFFFNLLKYRLLYDYYLIRIPNSDGDDYELALRSDDGNKDEKVLEKFQSMLYAGSASKSFYRWVAPLLDYLANEENDFSSTAIYKFLLSKDKEIRISEEKDISEKSLRYDNGVSFYWFRRLDFILWKKIVIDDDFKSELTYNIDKKVVDSMKFRRGGRSIEHLHPQNENENDKWNNYDNIHEFGNLALISSSFNSEQSNDNLRVKYGRIEQQIDSKQLQSIKLYLMYLASNGNGTRWNENLMHKHQQEMIELLKEELVV